MKSAKWATIIVIALFTLLPLPVHLAAQDQLATHHHYKLIDFGHSCPDSTTAPFAERVPTTQLWPAEPARPHLRDLCSPIS
jgi:hypothetical protein